MTNARIQPALEDSNFGCVNFHNSTPTQAERSSSAFKTAAYSAVCHLSLEKLSGILMRQNGFTPYKIRKFQASHR
jgi:hypothetical protein